MRALRGERNRGPAGARNLALAAAAGELVAFLDADDRLLPGYLETMVALYDAEQARSADVGIVACDATVVGPEGPLDRTYQAVTASPEGFADRPAAFQLGVRRACSARASWSRSSGGFSEECRGSEDHDLWLRILQSGHRIVATSEVLAVYNDTRAGLSHDPAGMARTTQATYRRALQRGGLTRPQRRIAGDRLLVARAAQAAAEIAAARRDGHALPPVGRLLRALPALLAAAVMHPLRWRGWVRNARRMTAPER